MVSMCIECLGNSNQHWASVQNTEDHVLHHSDSELVFECSLTAIVNS